MTSPRHIARQLLLTLLSHPADAQRAAARIDSGPDWQELFVQGQRHEVLPLVYCGLHCLPAGVVPARELARYRDLHVANALRNLQLNRELQRVTSLLNSGQIPVIPYKGPVLAEAAYGDLALRAYRDLDLLVPAGRAWQAWQLLAADGFSPGFEIRERSWPSLLRAINHLSLKHPRHDWIVELHWQLFHPMYLVPFDLAKVWQRLEPALSGVLDAEEMLLVSCIHGSKHVWQNLKWMVDVQRQVLANPQLDWQRTVKLAEESRSRRALLLGLELAGRLGSLGLPPAVAGLITADAAVVELADEVWRELFPDDPAQRQLIRECRFYLRSRERFFDRWCQLLRWLCWPRQSDWQLFPAGAYCFPLFYVERPLRMAWKWLARPLLRQGRGASSTGRD